MCSLIHHDDGHRARSSLRGLPLAGVAAVACFAGTQAASQITSYDGNRLVRFGLLSEQARIEPGASTTLALAFDVEPGWHIYWKNNGDSGMPPTFEFSLPEGVTVSELRWPAPRRYPQPGGLLDYIHEGRVLLLADLRLDESVEIGRRLEIGASAEWLVCKDLCVPGSSRSTLVVEAATEGEDSADAAALRAAEASMPLSPEAAARAGIRATFARGVLQIEAPGADGVTFFPAPSDVAIPTRMMELGTSDSDRLEIPYEEGADGTRRIDGVLEVRSSAGTTYYQLEVPTRGGD